MDENEQLTKLLKPVVAMQEQWFGLRHETPRVLSVQESAQRLDYLLGATITAYHYVIQKSENNPDINFTEWRCRYKPTDSELVSFYIGCWQLDSIIEILCRESKRTAEKIRTSLHRELILKQLELCRLMVNYSIEGDIWGRTFIAAISLIDLLDPEEDPAIMLTQLAQWECVRFEDDEDFIGEDSDDFRYPRFNNLNYGAEVLLILFGVGVDGALYLDGDVPRALNVKGSLVAMYDDDSKDIITVRYETSSGVLYREKGFWWNFGQDAEDLFDDLQMIFVRPEFVERFDLDEEHGHRFKIDEIGSYALSYEEIFPND